MVADLRHLISRKEMTRMKSWLIALALIVSVPAFANVKIGTYRGTTPEGAACEFEVKSVSFVNDVRHPLNERVEIAHHHHTFVLSHAPVINAVEKSVRFDHDHLTATQGVKGGAIAAIITMDHSEGKDGPGQFTMIHDNYSDASGSMMMTCGNLVAPN